MSVLANLNSMTQYPSIPTLHAMDSRGRLTNQVAVDFGTQEILGTEKIDGTNARIILLPTYDHVPATDRRAYLIGSRKEILTAQGDLVANPSQGIVDTLQWVAQRANVLDMRSARHLDRDESIRVLYGEVYGGKIGKASANYTNIGRVGFRFFDIVDIELAEWSSMIDWAPEKVAAWRDGGGQKFLGEEAFQLTAQACGLEYAPRIVSTTADRIATHNDAHALCRLTTSVHLDGTGGPAEGMVLRTLDRSLIAKIRVEDYRKATR